jgi:hypothetical protein
MKNLFQILIFVIFLGSCNVTNEKKEQAIFKYPQDTSISDKFGNPKDTCSSYFPNDSDCMYPYYMLGEKVLSNFYLGKEITRISMFCEFGPQYIFKLYKMNSKYILETIIYEEKGCINSKLDSVLNSGTINIIYHHSNNYSYYYQITKKVQNLSRAEQQIINSKISKINIWELPYEEIYKPEPGVMTLGGCAIFIEIHKKENYHCIVRHTSRNDTELLEDLTMELLNISKKYTAPNTVQNLAGREHYDTIYK